MNLLVISSCTGEKQTCGCPSPVTESDFENMLLLRQRETQLSAWALPAARLYSGWQHRYMMKGIDALRHRFGSSCCALKIISAGYGLVDGNRTLVPCDATFRGKSALWVEDRAQRLGIPDSVRESVKGFEVVIFLLGKEYLLSTHPPLAPDGAQRLIFFTSNVRLRFDPAATLVPAGKGEVRFGAGLVSLKGKMFELFAYGLCAKPEMWTHVLTDKTPASVLSLIEAGRSSKKDTWAELG